MNHLTPETVEELRDTDAITDETERLRTGMSIFKGAGLNEDVDIENDIQKCEKKQSIILEEKKNLTGEALENYKRGQRAEYVFRHAIQDFGWLADKVNMIIASQFDDYFRGIDSIAQIPVGKEGLEHIGFAMDFATSVEDIGKKLRQTFDSIDNGYTPTVKYFDSKHTGKKVDFRVPRIVIGAGSETLERLINYSKEILNKSGIAESCREAISNDVFQFVLFGEIIAQLGTFVNRLKSVVEQAKKTHRPDIEKRAYESLDIHEKAMQTVMKFAQDKKIDMSMIQKHIRGDSFAVKMAPALVALSHTSIDFK
ncbi:MAG: hypothetical protein AAB470_02980 [Patescibacteria group bacterium]